jgi:hypothetical protein
MRPQTTEDIVGLCYVIGFIFMLGLMVSATRMPAPLKRLIYAGLALRIVGGLARFVIFYEVYDGSGDAPGYYRRGWQYAQMLWQGDFRMFYDQSLWFGGYQWQETGFPPFPSMVVLALIGPSQIGEYVAFSLLAFLGLVGFAVAFKRMYPDIPLQRYARWIFLFPSLWYWPSNVGKEAIILMGLGLAFMGFIGKNDRIQWIPLLIGLFFVWAVRSQVAAIVVLCFMLAYWLGLSRRWTPGRLVQAAVILAIGAGGLYFALRTAGMQEFGVEGMQELVEANQATTVVKGSSVDKVGLSVTGIPIAMVNILTRPWPWEARSSTAFLAAIEILTFWGIVFYRRKNFVRALKTWRQHAVLRVAIPFIIMYSIALGLVVVNLGIIARQRVFLFPLLFLLLEAAPAVRRKRVAARPPMPYAVPRPAGPQVVGAGTTGVMGPQGAPPNVARGPAR